MSRYWNDTLYLQENELAHYGVLGMKWGVRRYQNADGSYTKAGLKKKAKRDKRAAQLEEDNKKLAADNKLRSTELNDLQARGLKSPVFKDAYDKHLLSNEAAGVPTITNRYDFLYNEKRWRKKDIASNKDRISSNKKLIDNINNTSLNDKTAFDKSSPYQTATVGSLAIGALLGGYAGYKLSGLGSVGGLGAVYGFTAGGIVAALAFGEKGNPNYWVDKENK